MVKRRGKTKALYGVMLALFLIYAISLLFPFVVVILNSFKTLGEFNNSIFSFPTELFKMGDPFKNYRELIQDYDILQMFGSTIILTIGGTILGTLFPTIIAFILAKYKFKFNSVIYTVALIFMMFPAVGNTVATIRLFYNLNFMTSVFGNFFGVLCLYAAPFGGYFFIMYAYYKGLSPTYMEAAYIDGANDFVIFFRIILPLSKAGLASIALLIGLNCWNDYLNPYLYMPEVKTLSTGLQEISYEAEVTGGLAMLRLFAAITCMALPVLIVFFINGKKIVENVSAGGIKE